MRFITVSKLHPNKRVRIHVVGPATQFGLGMSVTTVNYGELVGLEDLAAAYGELEAVLYREGTHIDFVAAGKRDIPVEQHYYDPEDFEQACMGVNDVLTKYRCRHNHKL